MKRRRGGAVGFLVGVAALIIIFLVILQWLGQNVVIPITTSTTTISGTRTITTAHSTTIVKKNSCTAESGANPSDAAPVPNSSNPTLPLSSVYTLPVLTVDDHSTISSELLNLTWWREVRDSSNQALFSLPPSMFWGFVNESKAMRDWTLQLMSGNAPAWVSGNDTNAVI